MFVGATGVPFRAAFDRLESSTWNETPLAEF
jgi:hypothetical protein